jgi:hypothetical protein
MKSGKLIAVDIEKEYVIFLKLEKCDSWKKGLAMFKYIRRADFLTANTIHSDI